jgi:hypothetical protein
MLRRGTPSLRDLYPVIEYGLTKATELRKRSSNIKVGRTVILIFVTCMPGSRPIGTLILLLGIPVKSVAALLR